VANSLLERLATARRVLGLSQRKMAEQLDVDPATLLGWEAGGITHQEELGAIVGVLHGRDL